MDRILSKEELLRRLRMFRDDENKRISIAMFAEAAGISHHYLRQIIAGKAPLSERNQRRLDRTLREYMNGNIVVMKNRDKTQYVEYRRESKPTARRTYGIGFENGEFRLKLGLRQTGDYSAPTLREQMDRGQK